VIPESNRVDKEATLRNSCIWAKVEGAEHLDPLPGSNVVNVPERFLNDADLIGETDDKLRTCPLVRLDPKTRTTRPCLHVCMHAYMHVCIYACMYTKTPIACFLFRLKNPDTKTPHTCLSQPHGGYCLRRYETPVA
jgi:hypothetical protein